MDCTLNIVSIGLAHVTELTVRKKVETSEPLLNSDGTFASATKYATEWEISVSGKGDIPPGITLAGDLPLQNYVSGGQTMIEELDRSRKSGAHGDWGIKAINAPLAA